MQEILSRTQETWDFGSHIGNLACDVHTVITVQYYCITVLKVL